MVFIIQQIDLFFRTAIVVPLLFALLYHFHIFKKERHIIRILHKVCCVLIFIFLVRCFLAQFIFTPVNYNRFADKSYFPLIKAIFYPE